MTNPGIDTPTTEELELLTAAAEAEDRYFHEHFDELYRTYPEQFVSVKDGAVLAANSDLFELTAELENRGVHVYDTWTKFLTKQGAKRTL